MKILAVDDEPYILELLPLLAAKVGFRDVTTVSSGVRALEALALVEAPFDCFVLDVSMPEMDGIDLCRRIRKIDMYRTTPILMLTAMSEHQFLDAAFRAGATDYATKPFDIHELGVRLRVAQELVVARREARAAQEHHLRTASANTPTRGFELPASDGIAVVGDFVDFDSLVNYLKQSSRAGLAASQLIAIKIDRIEDIYNRANADEYGYALREVANAITETFHAKGCLISHAGDGIFVVVSKSPTPLIAGEIESHVQHLIDERNIEYDSGNSMNIEVSVGNPILPNFSDLSEVPWSVQRAIARAKARTETKNDHVQAVNIRRF